MSLVVTSAATPFGRALAGALAALKPRERVVLADPEPQRLQPPEGFGVRHADPDDALSLGAAFAGAGAVVLMGGRLGRLDEARVACAVEAARAAGAERIVLLSSTNPVPGNPAPWADADRTAEALVMGAGLGWGVLRLQEDLDALVEGARRQAGGKVLITNRMTGLSAPVARADAAAAAARVLADPAFGGRILDLTGPRLVSSADLAASLGLGDVAHKDHKYLDQLLGEGLTRAEAEAEVALGRAVREGYYAVVSDTVAALTGKPAQGLAKIPS